MNRKQAKKAQMLEILGSRRPWQTRTDHFLPKEDYSEGRKIRPRRLYDENKKVLYRDPVFRRGEVAFIVAKVLELVKILFRCFRKAECTTEWSSFWQKTTKRLPNTGAICKEKTLFETE